MKKWSDKNDPFGPFNFSDFKKWMSSHDDNGNNAMVGVKVESKVPFKKLLSRIEAQEGDTYEVAKQFKKHGGTITEENGHYMYVSTGNGLFMIHKMYLKRTDD